MMISLLLLLVTCAAASPNIVFIVADDLGYNDISYHGSPQIPTPNIDAIFNNGVALRQYHAQPVCSPTRSSMLSGRHVIHTGIYMPFDHGVTNEHLNESYTLLPRYLKRAANYTSHLVGKWHLGANTVNVTPVGRGFDSALGYWSGAEDYESHSVSSSSGTVYDFVDDLTPFTQANNTFSTPIFAQKAIEILTHQATQGPNSDPLFLYLAFQNVHWCVL